MAQRTKIGLIYSYKKDWVAGSYYILNLIHALNQQNDEAKPELIILSQTPEEFETVKNIGYPYLRFQQFFERDFIDSYSLSDRIINKFTRIVFGRNVILKEPTNHCLKEPLDVLFPAPVNTAFSGVKYKLFWIPDFQEHFLPEFFSEQELISRKVNNQKIADSSCPIIFSSNNARDHFKQLFPRSKSPSFVLPFAVTHPDYQSLSFEGLATKFSIEQPYFFCANQFWAHKNHIVILKALNVLKSKSVDNVSVVFSGKESDYRNPDFFQGLKNYVSTNRLDEQVRFLGFIDRDEQLQLMNKAIAVIQPSLFEGWSTVVEDAKAMNQRMLVSSLEVHKEQLLGYHVSFFDPSDENALALLMEHYQQNAPPKELKVYSSHVKKFGEQFLNIIGEIRK